MRVAVALSGGVDSAVSAARTIQAGHDVTGVHLLLGAGSVPETKDAQAVADQLGIPLQVWDLRHRFDQRVIDYFVDAYEHARTPNPCLRCNRGVKFAGLLERGMCEGFDAIATGHYARIKRSADGFASLHRAANLRKDQSYVLGVLSQEDLGHCLFPLGEVKAKDEVRAEADRLGLSVAEKADSTDICFITDGGAPEFLAEKTTDKPGSIVDVDGRVLGSHHGIHHFTIGQRKGLRLTSPAPDGRPRYVIDLDHLDNRVVVGQRDDLLVSSVEITELSHTGRQLEADWHGLIQFRAHDMPVAGRLASPTTVVFDEPVSSVAPGQFVVFYDDDMVRGAAEILTTHRVGTGNHATHSDDARNSDQVPA